MFKLNHGYSNEKNERIIDGEIGDKSFILTVDKQGCLIDTKGNLLVMELVKIQTDADKSVKMCEEGYRGFKQVF